MIPARDEPPTQCLRAQLEAARAERLWVVHRLDRDTSGVLLFARTPDAHRALSVAFEQHRVRKRYDAFTLPAPPAATGVIDAALHAARKGKMRPALPGEPGALASRTEYAVLRTRACPAGEVAHVEARPATGRQHQIRVHLRSIGAPLLVDPLYARRDSLPAGALAPELPPLARLTLHARGLELAHPSRGTPLAVEAPLPDDLLPLARWLQS